MNLYASIVGSGLTVNLVIVNTGVKKGLWTTPTFIVVPIAGTIL